MRKEFTCQCRRRRFDPWVVGKILQRRERQHTPVFLPGKPMDRGGWRAATVREVARVRNDWVPKPPLHRYLGNANERIVTAGPVAAWGREWMRIRRFLPHAIAHPLRKGGLAEPHLHRLTEGQLSPGNTQVGKQSCGLTKLAGSRCPVSQAA